MSLLQRWFRFLLIVGLALNTSPIAAAAPVVHTPATGSFVVNTLSDSNAQDNFLSLREAILVANGSLAGVFTDAEKAQLGGCTFNGSTDNWTISGGCGSVITDTITFAITGTINLSNVLPAIADSAPLYLSGPSSAGNAIVLNAASLASGVDVLAITSNDNELSYLSFTQSNGRGLHVTGSNNLIHDDTFFSNSGSGIVIDGGSSNRILTNTIASNGAHGVWLTDTNTRFNAVHANTIFSNTGDGVYLSNGPQFNVIGSPIGGPRSQGNVVSGNTGNGIKLADAATAFNWVLGNNVGLNAGQTAAQPNGGAGIVLDSAASNIVGITTADGNVVAGNLKDGIALIGGAHDNTVQGNTIGGNSANTQALPNSWSGVAILLGAHDNFIGGTANNANLIRSAQYGVYISGSGTTTNTVSSNNIYGSGYDGVTIQNGASANTIGSSNPDERNLIADGARSGVYVTNANANRILRNDIWNNAYYGIILDGAATTGTYISRTVVFQNGYDGIGERNNTRLNVWTEISSFSNGGLGIDKQANNDAENAVNAPVAKITSSSSGGGITTLNGTGQNGTLIEVYGVAPDASGYGEGKTYLGQTLVSSGQWTLSLGSSAASCFTLLESGLLASSEFGPNTCRTFLPMMLR